MSDTLNQAQNPSNCCCDPCDAGACGDKGKADGAGAKGARGDCPCGPGCPCGSGCACPPACRCCG